MPALALPMPRDFSPPPAVLFVQRIESAVIDKYLMPPSPTAISSSTAPLTSTKKINHAQIAQATPQPELVSAPRSAAEQVSDHAAQLKAAFVSVGMHFEPRWRERIFTQIDRILDPEDWDFDEKMPEITSFQTLLRLLIFIRPACVPGLGLSSSGMLIASWTTDGDYLTIECHPKDELKWSLLIKEEGPQTVAAGAVATAKLMSELLPYRSNRWL